jgi:hypothetical protein
MGVEDPDFTSLCRLAKESRGALPRQVGGVSSDAPTYVHLCSYDMYAPMTALCTDGSRVNGRPNGRCGVSAAQEHLLFSGHATVCCVSQAEFARRFAQRLRSQPGGFKRRGLPDPAPPQQCLLHAMRGIRSTESEYNS